MRAQVSTRRFFVERRTNAYVIWDGVWLRTLRHQRYWRPIWSAGAYQWAWAEADRLNQCWARSQARRNRP